MIDDMYSLLKWAKEEELKAHNAAESCVTWQMEQVHLARKTAFTEMKDKIEKNPTELHRTLMNKPIKDVRKD